MASYKRKLVFINCIVLTLHSILVFAVTTLPVYALSAGGIQSTIASIIVSLMLQAGCAPVNNAWLQTLNTSYGIESSIGTIGNAIESGLLTQTATGLVDTGLSEAILAESAYTELGLAEIFTTTAEEGALAGSGAVNIANSAINAGNFGTLGAFAGAATIGVGVGILADHLRTAILGFIRSGVPITYDKTVVNGCPSTSTCYYTSYGGYGLTNYYTNYYYVPNNCSVGAYATSPYRYEVDAICDTTYNEKYTHIENIGTNTNFQSDGNIRFIPTTLPYHGGVGNWGTPDTNAPIFADYNSVSTYLNSVRENTNNKITPISPDMIGTDGNHRTQYNPETGEYEDPAIINVIPEGYDMKPVDMDDYIDFADEANQNTDNEDTGEPQATIFDNLIEDLLVKPSLVPDQGVDIPTIPDRPIIPDQPDLPGKDPITDAEQETINSGIVNSELANVFPFCIPFDLYALFGKLETGREAPVIVFEFPEQFGWGGITIDLSRWEEAAEILRHMELLLFIIGLAVNTRSLIGATG